MKEQTVTTPRERWLNTEHRPFPNGTGCRECTAYFGVVMPFPCSLAWLKGEGAAS